MIGFPQLQGMNAEVQRIFNEVRRKGAPTSNRKEHDFNLEERLLAPEGIERRRQNLVFTMTSQSMIMLKIPI